MSRDTGEDMKPTEHLLEHSEWLGSLARHLVKDPQEADDLVQDTWTVALRSGPRDETRYRSWLGQVLRNFAILNFRRRERRQARERFAAVNESVSGPEESVQKLEILRRIVDLVLALDDASRDVVILRYFEGFSGAEIARRLDLKPSAVRMRLKRALDQLRDDLDRQHGGDRSAWHASVALLAPELFHAPPATEPPAHAAPGGPAAGLLGGSAAVALTLGVAFAAGWASRGAGNPAAPPASPPLVSRAEDPDAGVGELRDALREARTCVEQNADELGAVRMRLAALEKIVDRWLAGDPA